MKHDVFNTIPNNLVSNESLNTNKSHESMKVFVVGEDFAGMRSQSLGLAERAGWDGIFYPVALNSVTRLALSGPVWTRQLFLQRWDKSQLEACFKRADPSVIISVGGKGGAVGAVLRSKQHPVVQVQHPRQSLSRFDLVIACRHDEVSGPNVLIGRTAVHGLTRDRLEAVRQLWAPRWKSLPRPIIGVLLGGSNGRYRFTKKNAHRLGQILLNTIRAEKGSLIVTPSRRTSSAVVSILSHYVQQAGGLLWNGEGENPYNGLIACADSLVVTIDSISMASEAVAGKAPVTIFPLVGSSRRINHFIDELEFSGRIRVLDPTEDRLPKAWYVQPLDDTDDVIGEMHQRLGF